MINFIEKSSVNELKGHWNEESLKIDKVGSKVWFDIIVSKMLIDINRENSIKNIAPR